MPGTNVIKDPVALSYSKDCFVRIIWEWSITCKLTSTKLIRFST